ncbi:MAG TPA: hypothetical protein VK196_03205 [Magnetospirillum sp.]|nr:hypothetical protein [Magnetospirillum sp.]
MTAPHSTAPEVGRGFRPSSLSLRNRLGRALWGLVWIFLYRPSPRIMHGWRRFLLRLFGARIGRGVAVHASVRIFAPWNLEMGDHSSLSHFVECYSVDHITIGPFATVSQYAFLCTASHDHRLLEMPLTHSPITIGAHAWVSADVFIAPGVTVGEGAMIQARSVVMEDVPAWTIAGGHPAVPLKPRRLMDAAGRTIGGNAA